MAKVRNTTTPRVSPAATVDAHSVLYNAELGMMQGENKAREHFAAQCKAAESAFPRDGSDEAQKAFKRALALDVFSARMGLEYDPSYTEAETLRGSITLREKPKAKTFGDDKDAYELALRIYAADQTARQRVSRIFGAAGQRHWEKPLAKDDAARETAKRGAKTPDAAPEFVAPDFKGDAALCGEWLAEITNMLFVTARKNGIAALTEFHERAEHNLIELFPVKEV